jgi:membrane-associated phospholipid phosphatase
MRNWLRLRAYEWIFVAFFAYIAAVSHWFPARPNLHRQPVVILVLVFALFQVIARLDRGGANRAMSMARDFIPMVVTLIAFREMEYFLPVDFDHHLEKIWIDWDRTFLDGWHVRAAIEKLGSILPIYLEFCYLLVYGLPFYCIGALYGQGKRPGIDRFLVVYLTGTLLAYALFPFFPSQPPRLVFPNVDNPGITTVLRRLNLAILRSATIHVGVFPSAHVSSAFSAAWGMFLLLPRRKIFGWALLVYAVSVSLATIYGRYHYVADVVAGFGVSLIAAVVAVLLHRAMGTPGETMPASVKEAGALSELRTPVVN